jgi:CheY-like chemotaxis protein
MKSGDAMSKAKIFIIEDQPLMRQAFSALLTGAGYDVAQAVSGEEALELAPSVRPDAVTINFNLPDTDGVSLAEKLRRLPELETIPFILVTSQNFPGNCAESPLPHIDSYINKEDLFDHLLPCIEHHLGDR